MYIDHAFSSTVGIAASGTTMSGQLLDRNGKAVDPCNAYKQRGVICPPAVKIGVANTPDIVPLAALLEAAGISSLDNMGQGVNGPGIAGKYLRYSGLVLYVQVRSVASNTPIP